MEFSQQDLERVNSNSLYKTVGILVDDAKDGKAHSRLRPNPALCWPFEGQPHGGVLFTLMDTTMAWAVLTATDQGYNCATINLDIQYTRQARGDIFNCDAWIIHKGSQVVYCRAEIVDEEGQLVANGQGAFWVKKTAS
ncbi:MAG: PaaI family thioesterase [Thermodesulfobacteriota bacterium]